MITTDNMAVSSDLYYPSGYSILVVQCHCFVPMQVPLPTALPALVEELEEYFWITSTATGENRDLLTVLTMGLVFTTVTTLLMLV